MNPLLDRLQPYPFQRLKALLADCPPSADLRPIDLSIGEPKHPAPALLIDALAAHLETGLAGYPATQGTPALRSAIADWLTRRYGIPRLDPASEVLPVNGSREALFSFVQAAIDRQGDETPLVLSPNPFYQIYEGAALLAGAEPYYLDCREENAFQPDWAAVPEAIWRRARVVFVCSPGNPTGAVMSLDDWRQLFELSDRHGFVIASDECYSEIWFDAPPLGALEAAHRLGRDRRRLVVFSSLSKRSNVPGLRSGFVAGDAAILAKFLLYRTYHGSAMAPAVQAASAAAWADEVHVEANRALYRAKFDAVLPLLGPVLGLTRPDAAFYLWAKTPERFGGDDEAFARALFRHCQVTVLPGSFLSRAAHGDNPGRGRIRMALVAPLADCVEAARRIAAFCAVPAEADDAIAAV